MLFCKISTYLASALGGKDAPHYYWPTKLVLTGMSLISFSIEYFPNLYEHLCLLDANSLDSSDKTMVHYQGAVGSSDGSPIPVFETTSPEHNQTMVCRLLQEPSKDYGCLFRDLESNNRVETNMPAMENPNLYFDPEIFDEDQLDVIVSVPGDECVINTIKNLQSSILYAQPPRYPNK